MTNPTQPSRPEIATVTTTKPCQNKTRIWRGGCDLVRTRSATLAAAPATGKPDGASDRSRNPSHRRQGPCRLLQREARIRRLLARDRQADRPRRVDARVVRRAGLSAVQEPAPGRRVPHPEFRVSGKWAAGETATTSSCQRNGAAFGSPLFFPRVPMNRAAPSTP